MSKSINTCIQKVLKDKSVLFIENSCGLSDGLEVVENLLIKNKIKYNCLFEISDIKFEYLCEQIKKSDCIIFQTQWVYDISRKIEKFMYTLKDKKIIIECFIGDPSWNCKPDTIHDIYIIQPPSIHFPDDKYIFCKLSDKSFYISKKNFEYNV